VKRDLDHRYSFSRSSTIDSSAAPIAPKLFEAAGITLQLYDHGAAVGRRAGVTGDGGIVHFPPIP
jgi:hypothetical protein